MNFIKKLFFNEKKYQEYLEIVKIDGLELRHVPRKYMTEELVKIAVIQNVFALAYVPSEYRTEELIFMAQQIDLYTGDIPTELTTQIFRIYRTMGE